MNQLLPLATMKRYLCNILTYNQIITIMRQKRQLFHMDLIPYYRLPEIVAIKL